jgi:predicted permease
MGAAVERRGTGDSDGMRNLGLEFRRWCGIAVMRSRSLLRRGRVETELDKELRFHVDEQTEENIVGVMPPGVEHPGNAYNPLANGETVDVWWPFTFQGDPNNRGSHYVEGIGRMKNGVTLAQAQAGLDALRAEMAKVHPADRGWNVMLIPLYQEIVGTSQRMLLVLLGAVGLVLLIACANAANLMLARATARQRELAVRAALGASRRRLIRQMLTESVLIAMVGGGLAAVLAGGGVKTLAALLPAGFPRTSAIHLNATVFAFTLIVSAATGILFGLAPAVHASRTDLHDSLREGGRGATGSRRQARLRGTLVIGEVSLACLLLVGAGLMLRSFLNLLTAGISLPAEQYKSRDAVARFYDQVVTNLGSLPGVQAAGAGTDLPWTGYDDNAGGFTIEGKKPPPHEMFHARYHVVTPGYFQALGTPLVHGRFFTQGDNRDAPAVLIINQAMAHRYWPGQDPIGWRITFDDAPKEKDWITIVGVVADVKDKPNSTAAEPAFWWPMLQLPWRFPNQFVVLRSSSDPALLANQLRLAVRQLDPSLAVADLRLMDRVADDAFSTPRFALFLVGLFAALAFMLAAIGIYGVISYSVSQRMHEFGMRMALGAGPREVVRLVMAHGLRLVVAGLALGLVCALALARILGNLLYEVSGADPLTFTAVSLLAVVTAALACYLPALRAARADPMIALRAE